MKTPEHIEREKGAPEWVRPNIAGETGELKRVLTNFLGKSQDVESVSALAKILENAPVVELSDEDWELLENTDSFDKVKPGEIEKAREICEEYNKELDSDTQRDFHGLLENFYKGSKMECPMILKNQEGKLHLVSGNTRLMIARALGVRPEVIIAQL